MRPIHNLKDLKFQRKLLRKNMTPQEHLLWSKLRGNQLDCRFRRQDSIGPYIVDFYCASAKLIIEIDGNQHLEKNNEFYDQERTRFLNDLGYRVIRFSNYEINNDLSMVINRIRQLID